MPAPADERNRSLRVPTPHTSWRTTRPRRHLPTFLSSILQMIVSVQSIPSPIPQPTHHFLPFIRLMQFYASGHQNPRMRGNLCRHGAYTPWPDGRNRHAATAWIPTMVQFIHVVMINGNVSLSGICNVRQIPSGMMKRWSVSRIDDAWNYKINL